MPRANANRLAVVAAALASAAGCAEDSPIIRPLPPVSAGKVSVRVFTEPAAVRAIVAIGRTTLVASDNGLERWDDGNATSLPELDGKRVDAIAISAPDGIAGAAWILSDAAVAHYDLASSQYVALAAPPPQGFTDLAALAREAPISLAADTGGDGDGVWIGTAHGLLYASEHGWTTTSLHDPIRALLSTPDHRLWIATATGVYTRGAAGDIARVDDTAGCALADARLLVEAPGERVIAIGTDDSGHDRIAIGNAAGWSTYRTLPDIHWTSAVRRGGGVVLVADAHAYRLTPGVGPARPLSRDGARLVAVLTASAAAAPGPGAAQNDASFANARRAADAWTAPPWSIDALDLNLPIGATSFASSDDALLIGTGDTGVARFRDGDRHPRDWLRSREMFADATSLTVACTHERDCWLATGAREAWHWTGDQFTASAPEDRDVLAVVRDPDNTVYAIVRDRDDLTALRIARRTGDGWSILKPALAAPSGATGTVELAFAQFASSGQLWLGARSHDDPSAFSVAAIDVDSGKLSLADKVPALVSAAAVRGNTEWFAGDSSVTRVANGKIVSWGERDGLHAEPIRALSIGPNGYPVIGSRSGVGMWSGSSWQFPPALRFEVNDLTATRSGLWLASERGLVAWDGKNLRRFDTLHGLAENEVLAVAADQFGRIWARGPSSLTLVSQ